MTLTNVDLSPIRSSDIHLRVITQEIPQPSISKISLEIEYIKFHSNPTGASKLNASVFKIWLRWYLLRSQLTETPVAYTIC